MKRGKMKKFVSMAVAGTMVMQCGICTAFAGSGGGVAEGVQKLNGYKMVEVPTNIISYESDVVMTYIQEFANFTQVPRPSYNTTKMAEYLEAWAEARGIQAETDTYGNVVMNVPATKGYEKAPLVAFQGHIDMVPAVDEGVVHDWDNDPLDLIWTSNSVKADGTSLGADNGSGVAFMLTYMDYKDTFKHGPMRFIFTSDEEVGLLGAHALETKHVADVEYFVNVDGGYGGAIISCAGGKFIEFTQDAEWEAMPADSVLYKMEFSGLKGGHSAAVGGGKANALVKMANAMLAMDQAGVEFNMVSFEGGSANNVIPNKSVATVAVKKADVEKVNATMARFAKLFKDSYEAVETDYTFTYGVAEGKAAKVLSNEVSVAMVQLMSAVPNNIHTLMATTTGTEASSNVGMMIWNDEKVGFSIFPRSSSTYALEQIMMTDQALAELTGFDMNVTVSFATWPMKAENKLGDMAAALFKEMTGEDYALSAIHGGVECGEFAEKNEDMYIISTGVSGGSAGHTTAETMNFDKVEDSVEFLVKLAEKLAVEG
ncbi:MAG: beta-Ala-His dipeptidase [Anaerotignum sp.]|nr:beta-Ala-His dipeptidase [Anaerotignum sp.]